jgi:uncharacterized protein YprB with RNaseH-like and TPR domain
VDAYFKNHPYTIWPTYWGWAFDPPFEGTIRERTNFFYNNPHFLTGSISGFSNKNASPRKEG